MGYVFFGGMRGTAWVNTFQTMLFLSFGAIAVAVDRAPAWAGSGSAMEAMLASPAHGAAADARARLAALLLQLHVHPAVVDRVSAHRHLLPDGAAARALPARRSSSIRSACSRSGCRRCSSASWPTARRDVPAIEAKLEARATLAAPGPTLAPERRATGCARRRRGDDVILRLVEGYAPLWLAALLGAAVMAAVMASDSQILALSTMFTEDVFAFYGGHGALRRGACRCRPAGCSSCCSRSSPTSIALRAPQSIFDLATPVRVRRLLGAVAAAGRGAVLEEAARKWGALASTLWTAAAVLGVAVAAVDRAGAAAGRRSFRCWSLGGVDVITRAAAGTMVFGLLPVVPMTIDLGAADGGRVAADAGSRARRPPRWRNTSRYRRIDDPCRHRERRAVAPDAAAVADLRRSPRSASRSTPTSC